MTGEIEEAIESVRSELFLHAFVRLSAEVFPRVRMAGEASTGVVDVKMIVIEVNLELVAIQML